MRRRGFSLRRFFLRKSAFFLYRKYRLYRLKVRFSRVLPTKRATLRFIRKRALWGVSINKRPAISLYINKSLYKYVIFRLKARWKKMMLGPLSHKQLMSAYTRRISLCKARKALRRVKRVFLRRPFQYYKPLARSLRVVTNLNFGQAVFPLDAVRRNFRGNYYDFFKEKSRDYTGKMRLARKFFRMRPRGWFRYEQMFFFARRQALNRAFLFIRTLPLNYRRTLFIQQVLLGDLVRLFLLRVTQDVRRLIRSAVNVSLIFLYNRKITPQVLSAFFIEKFRKMYLPGEVVARFFSKIVRSRRRRGKFIKGPLLWGLNALMVKASG